MRVVESLDELTELREPTIFCARDWLFGYEGTHDYYSVGVFVPDGKDVDRIGENLAETVKYVYGDRGVMEVIRGKAESQEGMDPGVVENDYWDFKPDGESYGSLDVEGGKVVSVLMPIPRSRDLARTFAFEAYCSIKVSAVQELI